MRARLGHLAGCVPGMCLEEITPALRKPWGGKGEGSLDRLSKAWGVYAPLVWHCSQFLPNERSSQVPQEESVSPTQVTSVWPLRFRVLCAHGSPVAEPVSVSLSTVLHKMRFVFSQRVALVWLELLTAHDGPGPRGVSHPGRTRCRRGLLARGLSETPTASPHSWEIPRLLFRRPGAVVNWQTLLPK